MQSMTDKVLLALCQSEMMWSAQCEGRDWKQATIASSMCTCAVGAIVRQKYAASSFHPHT